jgi:pimeloyl-ACP methyl ester carboxylesterase
MAKPNGHMITDAGEKAMSASTRSSLISPPGVRPPLRGAIREAVALVRPSPGLVADALAPALPVGDGHTVLVLPALLRGDGYTAATRRLLTLLGYDARGWGLGVNFGPTRGLLDGASDRLAALSREHGPLSLIGFSMGGLFARWLSLHMPDRVRQVITVCSPVQDPTRNFWFPVERFPGLWRGVDIGALAADIARPLPVPGTFLFSPNDGLVSTVACRDPYALDEDNIEITGPHVLIARNEMVMRIVASRLARDLDGGSVDRAPTYGPRGTNVAFR